MLEVLCKQNIWLSNKLKDSLVERIDERQTIFSDLLAFLHILDSYINGDDEYFQIFNKKPRTTLAKHIKLEECLYPMEKK